MKRIHIVAGVALVLTALVLANSQSQLQGPQTRQAPTATQQFTIERQVSTQQRINRYFHGDVVSKLKNCWNNVQGKGTITLKYIFAKAGSRWTFSRLGTEQSTLPRGQESVAEKCMSNAVRGSSFPVDSAETELNSFVLNWTWPVPLPANALELTTAMFAAKPAGGGGSGGCDGHGTPAKCYTCNASNQDLKCETVCVGKETCTITLQQGGSKTCGGETACASGGPFGVAGGSRVIF